MVEGRRRLGNDAMTMRDEQPASRSASAGASLEAPGPRRDVGGEQMFEERATAETSPGAPRILGVTARDLMTTLCLFPLCLF